MRWKEVLSYFAASDPVCEKCIVLSLESYASKNNGRGNAKLIGEALNWLCRLGNSCRRSRPKFFWDEEIGGESVRFIFHLVDVDGFDIVEKACGKPESDSEGSHVRLRVST